MFNLFKKAEEATTTQAPEQKTQFTDVRGKWKALAAERKITSSDLAALSLYRAMVKNEGKEGAISRLKKSFIPISNPIKLQNGARPYGSLESALFGIKYSTFYSWLDKQEQEAIIQLAKEIKISYKGEIQ